MSKRPERLRYTGKRGEHYNGVPARHLEARDIARLSDARLAEITAPHPTTGKALYVEPEPEKKPAKTPAKKPAKKQAPSPPPTPKEQHETVPGVNAPESPTESKAE